MQSGIQANSFTYNVTISACEKNALAYKALQLLEVMDGPDVISFSCTVRTFAKCKL